MSNENCINIIDNGRMNPAFTRGQNTIISKYYDEICADPNTLQDLWKKEYKATLINSKEEGFIKICFKTHQDLMMFMLRVG